MKQGVAILAVNVCVSACGGGTGAQAPGSAVSSVALPSPTPEPSGDWKVSSERNPMNDIETVTAMLEATTKDAALFVRCKGGKETTVHLGWEVVVGTEHAAVSTRIDTEEAEPTLWAVGSNFKTAFYRSRKKDTDEIFAKRLMAAKKLATWVIPNTPMPDGRLELISTFDLTGAPKAIGKVRDACHWKP